MSQRKPATIQAVALCTILAFALAPAKADSPHTFGHAAQEAGYNTATTSFDLRSKNIESLDGVKDYTASEVLSLDENQISSIPSGAFSGLSGLRELHLESNQISSIQSGAFSGLSGLRRLRLSYNQLTHLNLSGTTLLNLVNLRAYDGNTISSVDLSEATLSQPSFDVIVQDLDNGGVLSLDLSRADLSLVTSYGAVENWDDLESLDLSYATLGSGEIDFFTDNMDGLNNLTISGGQWNGFSGTIQDNLNTWDAVEGNTLTVEGLAAIVGIGIGGFTWSVDTFEIPTGSNDQLAPLDVDGVKEITLIFDGEVQLGPDVASLSGTNNSDVELFGPLTKPGSDPGTFQATWLLDSPLAPDEYTLTLFDSIVDLNGVQLDGEWIDAVSTISGDGIPGGDFVFRFNIGPPGSPSGPAVPEPSAMLLLLIGIVSIACGWRRRVAFHC